MSRLLSDLDPLFYPLACQLIALAAERTIPVFIVDTLRTPEEQADNIARGVSWTTNSKHLPQPFCPICGKRYPYLTQTCSKDGALLLPGKSCAIDICPYEVYALNGPDKLQWSAKHPAWLTLGAIGVGLGLRWGGTWKVATTPLSPKADLGHFEMVL